MDLLTCPLFFRSTIKEPSPRYFRIGVELDHVTALAFSDNNKRLVCATAKNKVRGFLLKVGRDTKRLEGNPFSAVRPAAPRS